MYYALLGRPRCGNPTDLLRYQHALMPFDLDLRSVHITSPVFLLLLSQLFLSSIRQRP